MDENKNIINPEENSTKADGNQPVLACDEINETVSVLVAKRVVLLRRMSTLIVAIALIGGVFVMTHGGLGWFANNFTAASNSMAINLVEKLFKVGVDVDEQHKDSRIVNVTDTAIAVGVFADEGYDSGILSADDKVGVVCGLTIDEGRETMRPGTSGTVVFRILPGSSSENYYAVSTKLTGIMQTGSESYGLLENATSNRRAEANRALNYLKGHILLFSDSSFTKRIDPDRGFEVECPGSYDDYTVTIYWKWPRRYVNLVETLSGAGISATDENISNAGIYLYNGTDRAGYNNADQAIGDVVKYISVVMTLNPIESFTPGIVTTSAIVTSGAAIIQQ